MARPPFPREALLGLDSKQDAQLADQSGTASRRHQQQEQQRRVAVESWSRRHLGEGQSGEDSCKVAEPPKGCPQLLTAQDPARLWSDLNFDKPVSEALPLWDADIGSRGMAPLGNPEPQLFPTGAQTVSQASLLGTLAPTNLSEGFASLPLTSPLTPTAQSIIHAPPATMGSWCCEAPICPKDLAARRMSGSSDVQGHGCVGQGLMLQPMDDVQPFANETSGECADALWQSSKPLFGTNQNVVIDAQPGAHEFKASLAQNETVDFSTDPQRECQSVQMWIQGATSNSSAMDGIMIKPSDGSVLVHGNDNHQSIPSLQQDPTIFSPVTCMPQDVPPLASLNEHASDFLATWKANNEKPRRDVLAATSASESIGLHGNSRMSTQLVCDDSSTHSSQEGSYNSFNLVASAGDAPPTKGDFQLLNTNCDKLDDVNFANNSCLIGNSELGQGQTSSVLLAQAQCAPLGNLSCETAHGCVDHRVGGDMAAQASGNWTNRAADILKVCENGPSKRSSNTFCEPNPSNSSPHSSNDGSVKSQQSDAARLGVGLKQKSSKYIGVSKHRRSGRWEAHIWINDYGRQVYLGGYDRPEDAACAYDVVAIKSKGLKASTNFNINRYLVLAEWLGKQTLPEVVTNVRRISRGFSRGTSRYRGVTLHPSGRWESRIGIHGNRHIYLGLYDDQEEAAKHYDRALVRLKGLKAVTNFGLSCYTAEVEEHDWMQQNGKNGVNQSGPAYERWIKLGGMKVPQHC